MNLNKRPNLPQDATYRTPAVTYYTLEVETCLAESNIEPIDEDGDEYEWIG